MASSRAIPIATILLRILTFILLAVATVVLVTDKVKSKDVFGNTSEITFKDIRAYRYVLAASVIGCAYTLIQIPFAVYWVATSKRMIHNDCLPNFDFYGDKIISFFLATAVGVGFGVTVELKKLLNDFVEAFSLGGEGGDSKLNKFFNVAHVTTGFLFLGLICMVILSILSSFNLAKRSGG